MRIGGYSLALCGLMHGGLEGVLAMSNIQVMLKKTKLDVGSDSTRLDMTPNICADQRS